MNRDDAQAILDEFIKNPNLKKHMLAVEAAMRFYAGQLNGDADEWGLVGLLHDFDWEIHPTAAEHPVKGEAILKARGLPDHLRRAILAHAPHS
ncbi:MAG: HAD family hydrolase, partial [Candidatus Kerfeldbacteria bacterium]|nr:HAD family hydrolase [Candidatus Kerfeldbacteria bacterium]